VDLSLSLEKDLWTTLLILATKAGVWMVLFSVSDLQQTATPLIQHGSRFVVEGCVVPGKPWEKPWVWNGI
jgi:hypothetical protein